MNAFCSALGSSVWMPCANKTSSLWHGGKIGASVAFDHPAQGVRGKDFYLVAPLVKVPDHFEPTGRVEPDNQTSIC